MKQRTIINVIACCMLLLNAGIMHAYDMRMHNETLSTINIRVDYFWPSLVCYPRRNIDIPPKGFKEKYSDGCCTEFVTVTALDGPLKDKSIKFKPADLGYDTGAGAVCKDYEFTITQTEDNQLAVKAGAP